MGQQAELPTREKGSYKRVWLNDLDSLIRSLQNQGIKEDFVEFTQYFLNDIQDFLPNDIEIKYTENSFVVYTAKHRAFKVRPETKNISCFGILKDYDKEYRVPLIKEIESKTMRIYKGRNKPSTAGYSESFSLRIKNKEIYEKQKVSIQNILQKSYDIAKNHWNKRLLIDPRKGTIKSALINIENDEAKTEEYAFKLLSENYTYDVE